MAKTLGACIVIVSALIAAWVFVADAAYKRAFGRRKARMEGIGLYDRVTTAPDKENTVAFEGTVAYLYSLPDKGPMATIKTDSGNYEELPLWKLKRLGD